MEKLFTVSDFEKYAKKQIPQHIFIYFENGSDQQITLKLNQTFFNNLLLVPRVLVNVANPNLSRNILGHRVSLPFGFSPVAMQKLITPEGERATSNVANHYNIPMTISTLTTVPLETLCQKTPDTTAPVRFLQSFILKDRVLTVQLLRQAQKCGITAVVITVDAQVLGNRLGEKRFGFNSHIAMPLLDMFKDRIQRDESKYFFIERDEGWDWTHVDWLREQTTMKIVLKGVMNPIDVVEATKHGVDAVWLSNHGGRQLDSIPPAAAILPLCRKALYEHNLTMPLFVDGGIRKGSDILKCLALGADFVFMGRPMIFGLAGGQAGLTKVVGILKEELERTMKMCGIRDLEHIKSLKMMDSSKGLL